MGFWIFMFVMELLIPLTLLCFGRRFMNRAPKEINHSFGYRTDRSMKNQDTWEFAHRYCGKIWFYSGLLMLPLSIIVMALVIGKENHTVGATGLVLCVLQMIPLMGAAIPTELALKKNFDETGHRR